MIDLILIISIIFLSLFILGKFWGALSNFYHKNYSYFNFLFLILYFIEQLLFLLLYNLYTGYRELWVGSIVLFVTTTVSLEKFTMDSRQRLISGLTRESLIERDKLLRNIKEQKGEIEFLKRENKSMFEFIKKRIL